MNTVQEDKIEKALRFNEGKLEWSLADFKALESLIKVLMFGKKKYGQDNWRKGLMYREVCDSMMRHQLAFLKGENFDEESKLHHLGHVMANAMFLMTFELDEKYANFDNRKKGQ